MAPAMDFIERNAKAKKPFFCWFNATHMHFRTHIKEESRGKAVQVPTRVGDSRGEAGDNVKKEELWQALPRARFW